MLNGAKLFRRDFHAIRTVAEQLDNLVRDRRLLCRSILRRQPLQRPGDDFFDVASECRVGFRGIQLVFADACA